MLKQLPESRIQYLSEAFASCTMCPRLCEVNRLTGKRGKCGSDSGISINTICLHRGEEPVISGPDGICNIFFNRCNLSCIYCQNHQISKNREEVVSRFSDMDQVVKRVIFFLEKGCRAVGFVSPSHFIPHVKQIIESLRLNGYNPIFVYNSNGYDNIDEIRALEEYIDIYLPDYKYSDNDLARKFSKVNDYQQVAISAIKEMYRQKGSSLLMNESGFAEKGLIIRHLVLPGHLENSLKALNDIADISISLAVSLMAQYWPTPGVKNHPTLSRTLTKQEYEIVKDEHEKLGFYKGWIQEIESNDHYLPDFEMDMPFE